MSNSKLPANTVALVTGAFSGIGLVTALRLAQDGARVYVAGRQLAKSAELSARAAAQGADIRPLVMDVTDEDAIHAALQHIEQESGRLDVLVNNAGGTFNGAVTDSSNSQIRQLFETNVIGMVGVTRAALPLMVRQGHGRVINLGSALGKIVFPGTGVYCATKFAMEALSDAMRMEFRILGPNFHVILIEPGFIKTQLGGHAANAEYAASSPFGPSFTQLISQAARDSIENGARPELVANAIAQAASARKPKSRYVVTSAAVGIMLLRRWLPDTIFDSLMMRLTKLNTYQASQQAAHGARSG